VPLTEAERTAATRRGGCQWQAIGKLKRRTKCLTDPNPGRFLDPRLMKRVRPAAVSARSRRSRQIRSHILESLGSGAGAWRATQSHRGTKMPAGAAQRVVYVLAEAFGCRARDGLLECCAPGHLRHQLEPQACGGASSTQHAGARTSCAGRHLKPDLTFDIRPN
jgi:hypothetical protein